MGMIPVGKHFDREIKIMRMVESLLVHNPEMDTGKAIRRATSFVDLQQRRFDQSTLKDFQEQFDEESRR